MSYTPTNWQTGDTVTAEKLNNMESGIENANNPFIVTLTPTAQDFSGTMDKTPAEIFSAYDDGRQILFSIPTMYAVVIPQQFLIIGEGHIVVAGQIMYDVNGQNVLINIATSSSSSTYSTTIFPLTQMS